MGERISVGLLGLGTVGSGVVQIIENHQDNLMHQVGCPVEIEKVLVSNVNKTRDVDIDPEKLTTNPDDVIQILMWMLS